MGRPKPIYSEIKALRKQLDDITASWESSTSTTASSNSASIRKCREAYTRLLEILSDPVQRKKLNDEAIRDDVYYNANNNELDDDEDDYSDDDDDDDDGYTHSQQRSSQQPRQQQQQQQQQTPRYRSKTTATATRTIRAIQRTALSEMWKSLITSSIHCIQQQTIRTMTLQRKNRKRKMNSNSSSSSSTVTTTTKYMEEDVRFPFQLLQLCFAPDPIFDTPIRISSSSQSISVFPTTTTTTTTTTSSTNNRTHKHHHHGLQSPTPPQQQHQQTSVLTNFVPSKLGKEQSKLLYHYCIDLLADIDQERDELQQQQREQQQRHDDRRPGDDTITGANASITVDTTSIDAVEQILLSMLLYMCGRTELVAYYKSLQHIRYILNNVIQPRILLLHSSMNNTATSTMTGLSNNINNTASTNAAATTIKNLEHNKIVTLTVCKIWYTLFHTCTNTHLGIGLQHNIIESYTMFTNWCQQQLIRLQQQHQQYDRSQASSSSVSFLREETANLLNAMTLLMQQHPDLCIASLQRHGSILIPFLHHCYEQYHVRLTFATNSTSTLHHIISFALHSFLLQYVIVCQEAGMLQGCISGDLGDLGKGSLTDKMIHMLIEVLITAVITHLNSSNNDKQQQNQLRIDSSYKTLLEVTIRLLNVAQRKFLVRNEWNAIENPTQVIIDCIEQQPDPEDLYGSTSKIPMNDDTFPTCSGVTISESPFIKYILHNIYTSVTTPAPATATTSIQTDSPSTLLQQALYMRLHDNAVQPLTTTALVNDKKLVAMLHILCAAAELFPLGSCWTTSTQSNWHTLSSCKRGNKSTAAFSNSLSPPDDFITIKGCSSSDLATIIDLLGNILSDYGSHLSSADVQKWTILTLIRLIVSTDELYNFESFTSINYYDSLIPVGNAWKRIWMIIHDTNNCYVARTTHLFDGSVGDLVLLLLIQIIRYSCTDPPIKGLERSVEFLIERHCDVWNLKVYEQFQIQSPTPFILIYTTLNRIGDRDIGRFAIGLVADRDEIWQARISRYGNGLRSKLICYCFHFLSFSEVWVNDAMMSVVSTCLVALINGFVAPLWSVRLATDRLEMNSIFNICDDIDKLPNSLDDDEYKQNEYVKRDNLFESLWSTSVLDISTCLATVHKPDLNSVLDFVEITRRLVQVRILQREIHAWSDGLTVSPSESYRFLALFQEDMDKIVSGCSSSSTGFEVTSERGDPILNLLLRISMVKATSTVIFSHSSKGMSAVSNFALELVSHILNDASSLLSSSLSGSTNMYLMTGNLVQLVRGLLSAHPGREYGWPEYFTSAVSALYASCNDMLENAVIIDSNDDDSPASKSGYKNNALLSNDSCNQITDTKPGKRKRRNKAMSRTLSSPQRRLFCCSRTCMFLISTLLIELNPAYKDFEFVAKRLLGVEVFEGLQDDYNIDILGGIFSIVILLSKACWPVPEMDEGISYSCDSIPFLISKVIRAIRSASDPNSVTHIFGYHICSMVVVKYDSCPWMHSMSSAEAKELVSDMLTSEKQKGWRSLTQRPRLRSKQLQAAITAFENADTNYHSEIDPLFGISCVLPSLSDSTKCVRRQSSSAVASAMTQLSEDKVVENVRRRLAPLTGSKDLSYRRWYASKIINGGLDESVSTIESQTWDDAYASVRYDTLLCWCVIAETTCARETVQQVLFDIVSAAVEDPCIEELCFLALERISARCGFSDIEMFLLSEMRNFAQRWLDKRWSFHQLPLFLCIPSVYRRMLQAGRLFSLKSEGVSFTEESRLDLNEVYDAAILAFLKRQSKHFLPQIVILPVVGIAQKAITMESRRALLSNDFFKEYCSALYGSYNDDIAKKVVCSLFPMVMAEASFLDANIANNLALLLKSLLTEKVWQTKCAVSSYLSFRRSLEIVGEVTSSETQDSIENVWLLSQLIDLKCQKSGSMLLQSARCSVPELLTFVRLSLDRSQTERQMILRWRSADAVLRLVIDDGQSIRSVIVAFCLDFLVGIINSQRLAPIRVRAIKIVEDILLLLTKATVCKGFELRSPLKTAFGALTSLHSRCQKQIKACCTELWKSREIFRLRGTTLIVASSGITSGSDFWDWIPTGSLPSMDVSLSEIWTSCKDHIPTTLVEQIVASYDALGLLIRTSLSLDNLHEVLGTYQVEPSEASICDQLSRINPSFSAQKLLSGIVREKLSIHDFDMKELKRMSEDSYIVEPAYMQMELKGLENVLRCLRTQSWDDNSRYIGYNENDLVLILASFCSESHKETTRIAASRCLAEISVLDNLKNETTSILCNKDNRLSDAIAQDCLFLFMQSLVVEAIAASVHAADSKTALIAIDTLKYLLATISGRNCAELLRETTSGESLVQIVSRTKSLNGSSLFLNDSEIAALRGSTHTSNDKSSKLWCWDDFFWMFDNNAISFESWISRLVSALLVCCYDEPGKKRADERLESFFSVCQRLSAREPKVACAMFPVIVLDLLLKEERHHSNDVLDDVLNDTWIGRFDGDTNIRVSRCLNVLLQHLPEGKNFRAIELVVELLDMLRRQTQHRFVTSKSHKMNKKRNKDVKEKSTQNTVATNESKNTLWHGAPYGVVLHLDGLLVANACIRSRRFESAIFYAELFADVRFGGPQRASIVDNSSLPSSSRYISGFGMNGDDNVAIRDDIKSYFEILRQSYAAIGDDTSREAIDQIESDFNFNTKQDSMPTTSSIIRDAPSLRKLLFLDNASVRGVNGNKMRLPILNCLDGLGFHGLLETYIRDLTSTAYADKHGALQDNEFLREKMFECRLYSKQWDDPVYNYLDKGIAPDVDNTGSHANSEQPWSSIVNTENQCTSAGFYENVTMALDTIKRGDLLTSQKCLLDARLRFVDGLISNGSSMSISKNVTLCIDHLRTLNDLEDYVFNPDSTDYLRRIIAPVDIVRGSSYSRSSFSDSIRTTVMNFIRTPDRIWNSISKTLADDLELQFQLHLRGNRHQEAQESLYRLDSVRSSNISPIFRLELRLNEAKLFESRNDFTSAIRTVKLIIKNLQEWKQNNDIDCLRADALLLCGQWMAKHKVEPASSVLAHYLQPAAECAQRIYSDDNDVSNANRATRALLAQGQLVANLFDAVSNRITGADWHKAELSLTERELECQTLQDQTGLSNLNDTDKMYRHYLEKEIRETRKQRNFIVDSLETYRTQAVKCIASAFAIAGDVGPEDRSKHVYRLIGILFSSDTTWSKGIDDAANYAINSIPTYRFVPLVNQLLSRINSAKGLQKASFQNRLQTLIQKVSFDHPYHCFIHLISLSEMKNGLETDTNDKAEGAHLILSIVTRDDPVFRAELIESYKKLYFAYIHLATKKTTELEITSKSNVSFDKLSKNSSLRLDMCLGSGARKAQYVPCILTKPPTVSPGKEYGNGNEDPNGSELVKTFESTFAIADSGVTEPKIVVCVGSRQGRFKQLVKGEDDTRQDAVMEQVFAYANDTLKRQRHSNSKESPVPSTHDLRLVTYNIVPLSHVAGILEWVEHSTPFGDFIVDKISTRKVGAHSRYFPTEWSSDHCRRIITRLRKEGEDTENKDRDGFDLKKKLRGAFDMIYECHSPVFRFFFVENFLNPEIWYASKMRYTRSVAVGSIVGHILGIGDRHMSNILVHQKTGEVIHIDFGFVFEQGKRLRIPENVPFRLTRNVVDGMGPIGVEGTFTKAAVDTLAALKENANGLLTILSAIVSDPLYKWSISSKKRRHRISVEHGGDEDNEEFLRDQDNHNIDHEGDENRNEVAAHAISRIHDKLLGYEDGTSGEQQSVESQVQLLINAAQDVDNLCTMFVGWAPFQ